MTKTNNKYGLKNFRVFGDESAEFEIAPVTVITGQNSSGKSSVFKSLMLLNNALKNIKSEYIEKKFYNPFDSIRLKFHEGKHNMGTYSKTINKYSNSNTFNLSYSVFSEFLQESVNIDMNFGLKEDDFLKSAELKGLKITLKNKDLLDIKSLDSNSSLSFSSNFYILFPCFQDFMFKKLEIYDPIQKNNSQGVYDYETFVEASSKIEYTYSQLDDTKAKKYDEYQRCKNKHFDIDNVGELFRTRDDLNYETFSMLLYLPFEKYFDKFGKNEIKENFNTRVFELIETDKFNSASIQNSIKLIHHFFDLFIESEFTTFVDFYKYHELLFISEHFNDPSLSNMLIALYGYRSGNNNFNLLGSLQNYFSLHKPPHGRYIDITYEEITKNSDLEQILTGNKFDFEIFYRAFLDLFFKIDGAISGNRFTDASPEELENRTSYYAAYNPVEFEFFNKFITGVLQETLVNIPSFLIENTFMDAIRANTQRMYTFKEKEVEFNRLMINYLNISGRTFKESDNSDYKVGTFTKDWIQRFEIADDILFETTGEGLGVHIYVIRGENKTLLADEGFGITQLLSILLQVELNIVGASYKTYTSSIVENKLSHQDSTISIEEPESNLHPKFQSLLADMFIDAYKRFNIRFMVETHSEYLIRKLQTLAAKKDIEPDDVSIHYIYSPDKKKRPQGTRHVEKIDILSDGRLNKPFGTGFFDEADNLALDLLTLKSLN